MNTKTINNKKSEVVTLTPTPTLTTTLTSVSPYGAHQIVNDILKSHPSPLINTLKIRPQMMYNYTTVRVNKGLKPFIPFNPTTNRIETSDIVIWTNKYITKKLTFVQPTE